MSCYAPLHDHADLELPLLDVETEEAVAKEREERVFSRMLGREVVTFDEAEIIRLSQLAEFIGGNPRRMKRIVNSYAVQRALAMCDDDEQWAVFREKLLRWTVFCEQWPTRVSWILQIISDEQNEYPDLFNSHAASMTLGDFYKRFVECRVYDTELHGCIDKLRQQYSKLFLLDDDPDVFDTLLFLQPPILISDIGDMAIRRKHYLFSFTTNLNPAVRFTLARICASREEQETLDRHLTRSYLRRCIFDMPKGDSSSSLRDERRIHILASQIDLSQSADQGGSAKKRADIESKKDALKLVEHLGGQGQKMETGGALRDSMEGPDLVGYKAYAEALAKLVLCLVTCPLVVGLYAAWGTGKSFIMNKLVTQLKYAALLQKLKTDDDLDATERRERVALLEKWATEDAEDKIHMEWDKTFHQQSSNEFSVFSELWDLFVAWPAIFFEMCCYCCRCCFCCCGRRSRPAERGTSDSSHVEYEFVWFNAWLYNGTSNLWASLILKLYQAVEMHYGPEYAYARRRALLWSLVFRVFLTLVSLGVGMLFNEFVFHVQPSGDEELKKSTLGYLAAIPPLLATLTSVYQNVRVPISLSSGLLDDANQKNLRDQLGFMDVVRSNLFDIGKLLQEPDTVPTTWDYLLSKKWCPPCVRRCITSHFRQKAFGHHMPCRFVIFVDDLDRCDPDKCVEVLASINLMCEGLPFVIVLAIDPRVVVCSIESANQGFYEQVGVSGYSYLDKIVQLPFAIPELCTSEKKTMLRGFLTGKGSATRDYSLISSFDNVCNTGRETYPNGVTFIKGKLLWVGFYGHAKLVDPDTSAVIQELDWKKYGSMSQITTSSRGNIYVAATRTNRILMFSSDYEFLGEIGEGYLRGPRGVAATMNLIYIADSANNRVVLVDAHTLAVKDTVPSEDSDNPMNYPTALAVIENRYLVVADRNNHQVQVLKLDGTHTHNIGKGVLKSPNDVSADADGNLLVYDTGNCRLVLFSLQGHYLTAIMTGFFLDTGNTFSSIACCLETGRVAISDNDGHRIALLKPHLY
eukprot:TRINITY_DN21013_c0_g2_i1.p1 TRINITY_DN21013_c0_g2~~TRINITY_DN21013_c0_g2_i1.p1  ORF type:complete len:1031 (+),score=136.20 TRINITY_DN21013_c0_g2_i1:100-3192(+)